MPDYPGSSRERYVEEMFSRLAERYEIANCWMTWGQDTRWRKKVIDLAGLPRGGRLLDVGAGTGELALEATRRDPTLLAVGMDITPEMMQKGREKPGGRAIYWLNTNALKLPFYFEMFDAVVSAYLMRNVVDVEAALAEQLRVLKPGGRVVCLDTTPPPGDIWHIPVRLYLRWIIPTIGGLSTGDFKAYQYLARSTRSFMPAEELANRMQKVGFRGVQFQRFMGGSMAIHWASK